MTILHDQLSSAIERLAVLRRRFEDQPGEPSRLARDTVKALDQTLDELRIAQEQMIEQQRALELAQTEVRRERNRYWQLLDATPDPYLVTGKDSRITEANRAAAALLNISQRFLVGKSLSLFVCRERGRFLVDAARVAVSGESADLMFNVRPRERAPVEVSARVIAGEESGGRALHWILRPSAVSTAGVRLA